jgi:multisubunit Na+/H+ antiporter MnhB subunit
VTDSHDQSGAGRAKPQYGEYAPPGWSWTPPVDEQSAREEERTPEPTPAPALAHPVDRAITIALLALGAFFALSALFDSSGFAKMLQQQYAAQGIGEYGSPELARSLGVASGVGQTLIVAIATWLAVRRIRAGKRAVLVPILGIVVTALFSLVIAAIAILGDPTFSEYVTRMS